MAGFMAENWQKIGSVTADDMAMKIWYSVIVQKLGDGSKPLSIRMAAVRIGSGFLLPNFI